MRCAAAPAIVKRVLVAALISATSALAFGSIVRGATQTDPSARFDAIEQRLGGRLGVALLDTGSGRRIEHRASERFAMCSTFKLLAVAALLSRVDRGREQLERFVKYGPADLLDYAPITKQRVSEGGMTLAELSAAAIEYSDNTAANLVLAAIGGPRAVTAYARSLGDTVTRLDRNEPSLNLVEPRDVRDTTSPTAMLGDMQRVLVDESVLTSGSREQLATWLIGNTTGAGRLRAGLPAAWRVGDKTGSCTHGATNDIAVAWPPGRLPVLIAVYFNGSAAPDADRIGALAEAGRIVADALSR